MRLEIPGVAIRTGAPSPAGEITVALDVVDEDAFREWAIARWLRRSLTVADVAEQLEVCEETVRRLVRVRALRATRSGAGPRAPLRFTQGDVDDYLARRRV